MHRITTFVFALILMLACTTRTISDVGGESSSDTGESSTGTDSTEQPCDLPVNLRWCCDCDSAPPLQCQLAESCLGDEIECGDGHEYPSACLVESCDPLGWCCDCASLVTPLWDCRPSALGSCSGNGLAWCEIDEMGGYSNCTVSCSY